MFLSKKGILSIISVTGISFLLLLFIQFGWTQKSMKLTRQRFANKMMVVSNRIGEAFLSDKTVRETWLSGSAEKKDLFTGDSSLQGFERVIKYKLDSVLKSEHMPLSTNIAGRRGKRCYLMNIVPAALHNLDLDQSPYKLCLCDNSQPLALDIGFDLVDSGKWVAADSSGLILPSVILIVLLIALFTYIISVINRQKSLAELKNDFINNLTHEFNTPLFSIGLTSSLLLRSEAIYHSDKLKGYVELITTEKNRLQSQVDKILRLTAIESGGLVMEKERVNMHQVIEENIARFALAIAEKGGTISFKEGAVNYFVWGDRVHLFNAFSNLLDNACKYSDKTPEIVVTTHSIDNELIIHITDNGIGMTKAEASMIFAKFYRVKQGDRHDVKGFGLGLSYVKKIVDLHNGSIEVRSEPGGGSVFTIHLPNGQ